jgi:predicted secreted protein
VIATLTVPLNEFAAVARTLTFAPVAPTVKASVVGWRLNEKLGGELTVKATLAAELSAPDVPVNLIVAEPAAAVPVAVSVTDCAAAPGVRVTLEGAAVTPAGSPVIATLTD